MNLEELKKHWLQEEQYAFEGWNFSHINNRWESEKLPWDYKKVLKTYLKTTDSLLDMGTGGGEFLLSLKHPHSLTSVTEAYPPNVKLCKEKLVPMGVTVHQIYEDDYIPYAKDSFDMVINRHESFDVNEVNRVLKPNKVFVTQQVGGRNNVDLSRRLINDYIHEHKDHNLENNIRLLKKAEFDILYADESYMPIKFFDVGAFVYFAKIINWEFPRFSVKKHFDKLCDFHNEIQQKGYIEGTEHRFIIAAKKKDSNK